jgi:hypothetical protein
MNDNFRIFLPNPDNVAYELEQARLKYPPNDRRNDWAFAKTPVMPICYKYVVLKGEIPPIAELGNFVIKSAWPNLSEHSEPHRNSVHTRARKLVMDFYRDLHTMGLLGLKFGSVTYERGMDISFNVDYIVTPKRYLFVFENVPRNEKLAVASAMMHPRNWRNPENDIAEKKRRRERRGCKEWGGEIFWLTNMTRQFHRSVNGVWLFGQAHINDLLEDIKAKYSNGPDNRVGISQQPDLF